MTGEDRGRRRGEAGGDGSESAREPEWVDRPDALADVVGAIGSGPLAVDTEADSYHRYREKICLVQLSFSNRDVLVDPLSGVDLDGLGGVLGDRLVLKILHGADYDLRLLERHSSIVVRGLFDTMIAARFVGERAFGLSALLEKYVGVRLDKQFQRADWSSRPLSPEMVRYAALDTRHLAELAERLASRLSELGRSEWAEEEFRQLEQVRWDGDRRDGEPWLRLKGAGSLVGRQLAVAREIAALREGAARRRDVPVFRVMRDDLLIELSRRAPRSRADLERIRGLSRVWKQGTGARRLLEAIARAHASSPDEWPVWPRPPRRARPSREQVARLGRLRQERDRLAEELDLEPCVVASRSLLEALLASRDAGGSIDDVPDLRHWQRDLLRPALAALGG